MRFLLQLDFDAIPSSSLPRPTSSLLQLFYCSTDDGTCETWRPHSGTHHFRTRTRDATIQSGPIEPLNRVLIGGWREFDDFPSAAEHTTLGIDYDYDFRAGVVAVRCADPPIVLPKLALEMEVAEIIANAAPGDKLLGWPSWVQGVEYPQCPRCEQYMSLVFQIDSNDNLDYMFGDAGIAHVTRCNMHPDEFAFGWACG